VLSSLPKLADRSFIIGFFLPSLLFCLAVLVTSRDHPAVEQLVEKLAAKDIGNGVFVLVGVWVSGVVMLVINHPLYRFLEGYTWPLSKLEAARERYRRRLRRAKAEVRTLAQRWAKAGDSFPEAELKRYQRVQSTVLARLPSRESDVMPTAFGNAIKAFEIYPRDVYGADGPTVWLRLVSVMPKTYLDQIQDVRSQIDFLINCCFLSGLLALVELADALSKRPARQFVVDALTGSIASTSGLPWVQLTCSGLACIMAFGCYLWAVSRVPAWGQVVMSGFDCYLPALAAQLGFSLPRTGVEREAFWTALSQMLIYRRDPYGDLPFRPEEWPQAVSKAEEGGKPRQTGVDYREKRGDVAEDATPDDEI